MKHLLTFPTWIIFSILLTLLILIVALGRWEWDAEIFSEVSGYKDFVESVINQSK